MKRILLVFSFLTTLLSIHLQAQAPAPIKVKRAQQGFYFYQKGKTSDTITLSKGNAFYFLAGDSLKKRLTVLVENGRLLSTPNDSIFVFKFMKGMRYECFFKQADVKPGSKPRYEFRSLVNGASEQPGSKVFIRFKLANEPGPFLENTFYYKN